MDFHHSEERQMLADTLGRYLQQRYPFDARLSIATSAAGWSREHWNALAELGAVGALFGQETGGFGGTGADIAAVFEQLGRALNVEPFLNTLMAGRALALAGIPQTLLERAIQGSVILAFAHEEPQSRYELADVSVTALRDNDTWLLAGIKAVVPQLESANYVVVSGRISGMPREETGIGLFIVERNAAGLAVRGYPMIDGGRGGELLLDRTPASLVSDAGYCLIEEAVAAGIVALAWEAVGVMDVLYTATLDYLRTRQQFGVPIGRFQALQHRMATVALEIEQVRSAAINAADALGHPRIKRAVSAAKYTIGRVGTLVAEETIQMHGGIGMTWELPVSHFAKRLIMIGHQLGDEDYHLSRFSAFGRAA
jgi:alkylation response protein AidB-like acyl-CoA dehydrogenase